MLCVMEGCLNEAGVPGSARGLCRAHYHRWQRYGDPGAPLRRLASYAGETCTEPSCDRPAKIRGLCLNCYAIWRRRTNPQRWRNRRARARQRERQELAMGRPRPERCEVCDSLGTICFDHDHETGQPRGWLCDRCNKVLGLVADNERLLCALAAHLNRSRAGVGVANDVEQEERYGRS